MVITKAIKHFKWKFQNKWKATEADLEAYNAIIDYYEKTEKEVYNNNQLFAKLYITRYGDLLQYYDGTVFDMIPQKELHRLLDRDLDLIIEKFVRIANQQQRWTQMIDAGMTLKHPLLMSQSEKKADLEKFDLKMLDPVITFDEAKENLTKLINLALNEFS